MRILYTNTWAIIQHDTTTIVGYALPVILRAINEKYGKGKESDILEHFDLVAGISIGGSLAFACNRMKSL